jgi:hypothetical protein
VPGASEKSRKTIGFRPTADPLAWLAALGILVLFTFALVWLSAALGLAAKSVETASNTPTFLTLLPFLSSGFVPTATMPAGLRQCAEYQPFTPVTQTLRGLLTDTSVGTNHAIAAVAWSVGIALACYFWGVRLGVIPVPSRLQEGCIRLSVRMIRGSQREPGSASPVRIQPGTPASRPHPGRHRVGSCHRRAAHGDAHPDAERQ